MTRKRKVQDVSEVSPGWLSLGDLSGYRESPRVWVTVNTAVDEAGDALVNLDRADFLAAVASELNVRIVPADAIVVERSELPEVVEDEKGCLTANGETYTWRTADTQERMRWVRDRAIAVLLYMEANPDGPPVDEVQLAAIDAAVCAAGLGRFDKGESVRALYRAGVRVVTS